MLKGESVDEIITVDPKTAEPAEGLAWTGYVIALEEKLTRLLNPDPETSRLALGKISGHCELESTMAIADAGIMKVRAEFIRHAAADYRVAM